MHMIVNYTCVHMIIKLHMCTYDSKSHMCTQDSKLHMCTYDSKLIVKLFNYYVSIIFNLSYVHCKIMFQFTTQGLLY